MMKLDTHLYYLLAMFLSVVFPIALSFDKKVNFKQYFPTLSISLICIALPFIIGDIVYTKLGVWGFNPEYHLAVKIGELPLEEISFFLIIPYSCIFIYAVLRAYFNLGNRFNIRPILVLAGFLLAILAAIYNNKLYTSATFGFSAILIFYLIWKKKEYTNALLIAYTVSLLPFLIVNGFLTGMFMEEPIVWYNNLENLGIRVISIPVEDFSYSFNLIALNVILFEIVKSRFSKNEKILN